MMYTTRRLLLLVTIIAMVSWGSPVSQAQTETETLALRVSSPDLDTVFYLEHKPEWTPSTSEHVIDYMGAKYVIPNNRDTQITIIRTEALGIDEISGENITAEICDNTVVIRTGGQPAILRIVNELGRVVYSHDIAAQSIYNYSIDNLESGIYILSIGTQTFKFIKK